ncbi:MAG: NCS2 family permease [Bacilli bacterium]|nr:NCS2 family permease [Bacilli bacterium]
MERVNKKLVWFNLKGNNTTWQKEVVAGITTFFAMAYIIIVNPNMLSQTGMEWGAVFIATIISSVVGTLVMGLFANVPYALAPGMGLNAFFTYTVCFQLGFTWQTALSMVFICGLINVLITVTKVRKLLIKAIPPFLQNAISAGIGAFIIYIGLLNVGFINFSSGVPAMSILNTPSLWVFIFGLVLTIILVVLKVPGGILIGIIATTLFGLIPFGGTQVTSVSASINIGDAFKALPKTFGVIFTSEGLGSLFSNGATIPLVLITIFSFSLSDTFDTIGTFIGTGRKSNIFSDSDLKALETSTGFKSKMDKALFADSIATSIGAIFGTSNTTTYVESAAGIESGGRTGLTSVITSACFALSLLLIGPISAIPSSATSAALIIVGCMMLGSLKEIEWSDLTKVIPSFFCFLFMAFAYSISYGIAMGFISYCLIQIVIFAKDYIKYRLALKKEEKNAIKPKLKISLILGIATVLFLLNFILMATPMMN